MAAQGVVYIEVDGHKEPAWTCGCGERKPGEPTGIVEFAEPRSGVRYGVCHLSCIRPA